MLLTVDYESRNRRLTSRLGHSLPLIERGTLGLPGGCRDARHSPEGEGPPSRGRPFGLLPELCGPYTFVSWPD